MTKEHLIMQSALELFLNDTMIFYSNARWLYPLFELEEFLRQHYYDPGRLLLKDKIVGRAAALLQVYLGITNVQAELMSRPGKEILDRFHVKYEYDELVDRIQCQTEEWLKNEFNPEKAYQLIKALSKTGH